MSTEAADPAATADFVYESIAGDKRLPLKARYLTEREMSLHERTVRERIEGKQMNDPDALAARDELITLGVRGMTLDQLKGALTTRDLYSLATGYPEATDLKEYILGKSNSRARFIVDTSAADVVAQPASTEAAASATSPPPSAP